MRFTKEVVAKSNKYWAALVPAIREYANDHYEENGWDVVVETWDDDDLRKAIGYATTFKGALKKVQTKNGYFVAYRDEIAATAF